MPPYYDINFIAKRLKVKVANVRYWIKAFNLTIKQSNGLHYKFTSEDLIELMEIKNLLKNRKFTIEGAIQERASTYFKDEIEAMLRVG